MPPLYFHLVIAREAAWRLRHPIVDRNLGSYLLGSTAPDIRIISGATREETHFFNLEQEGEGSGVRLFLGNHPLLSRKKGFVERTMSFVAGYLSHLVTDEAWISKVYRPCFGKSSPLGKDSMADVLDKALQFELDRRERVGGGDRAAFRAALSDSYERVSLDFIDEVALRQWSELVCATVEREPTWERFRLFAERTSLFPEKKLEPGQVERFLADIPTMLKRVLGQIGEARLKAFREKAIADSVKAAEEYLD